MPGAIRLWGSFLASCNSRIDRARRVGAQTSLWRVRDGGVDLTSGHPGGTQKSIKILTFFHLPPIPPKITKMVPKGTQKLPK